MIWNFIIIGAVILIFIILARRLPVASGVIKQESPEEKKKEIVKMSLMAQANDAFDQRNFDKAEELYIKAAAQDPKNAEIYNHLGVVFLEKKNYFDAKDSFIQAIKLDQKNALGYVNLGLAYMGLKDYYKSCQSFDEALKFDPKETKYKKLLEKAQKAHEREKKRVKR